MLLTIVITKNEIHTLIKRRNDPTVLKYSKATNDLGSCFNESIKQAMAKGWKVMKPVSTAIILPFDSTGWRARIDAFKQKYANDARIVFEDNLASSYLKGSGKNISSSDYVIISNKGEGSELFFYKSEGNSQLSLLPEMNSVDGLKKVSDHVIAAFAKEGLMLGANQERQIFDQVKKGGKGGKYTIEKKSGNITINAQIEVSSSEYEDKISSKRSLLSKYLHPKILQTSPKLKEVILVGEYFDNQVVQNYLKKDLELSAFLNRSSFTTMESVVNSASLVGFSGIENFLAAQHAEDERISALRKKRDAKLARESLLMEIRQTCTDYRKADEYKKVFGKKADELGIPREVVMWNIDEIIDTLELEEELGKKTEIPVISSSSNVNITKSENLSISNVTPKPAAKPVTAAKKTVTPQPKPAPVKPKPPVRQVKTSDIGQGKPAASKSGGKLKASSGNDLSSIFKTKEDLSRIGFHAQIGEMVNQPGTERVIRFISTSEARVKTVMANFEKLHTKESMYYENMSPIHSATFGKYYYRDSLEGETLSNYIKKNASRFKSDIEKWSSADLKLILKIWKEVTNLDYSYDIEADDIIILSKLTWSLKREMDIKLVNFNAKEITKKQMEDKMHKALLQLFGKKIYQNLRKKFSI